MANPHGSLRSQVAAQIRFAHGCNRVLAHGWMAIDSIDLACFLREEMSKGHKSAEARRTNHDRHKFRLKHCISDFHGSPNGAARWGAVKRRTGLVVGDRCSKLFECCKDSWKVGGHPFRTSAPAVSGNSYGLAVR